VKTEMMKKTEFWTGWSSGAHKALLLKMRTTGYSRELAVANPGGETLKYSFDKKDLLHSIKTSPDRTLKRRLQ